MAPATESAIIPLQPHLDLTTGDPAQAIRTALDTIKAQPGCQRVVWGRKVENPDEAQMLIDWDTLDSHKTFIASPAYPPFRTALLSLVSGPPTLTHHHLAAPLAPATAAAPVTELASFYFSAHFDPAAWQAPWEAFAAAAGSEAKGLVAAAAGWGAEEVEHGSLGSEGELGKVFLAAIGWESVEAHMAYRETAAFRESIAPLRALVKGVEMHHVEFESA